MAGNIEDFLRRAIQQKLGKRVEDVEVLPAAEVQPQPAQAAGLADASVADHVAAHLDTTGYSERASHLAEDLGQTDERLEDHLHAAFDHEVGALEHPDDDLTQSASKGKKSAESNKLSLKQLFRSKSALRNAIIVREVFDRPAHRW